VGLVIACLCSDGELSLRLYNAHPHDTRLLSAVLYLRLYALSKQDFTSSSSRFIKIILICNFTVRLQTYAENLAEALGPSLSQRDF
jgi:hypothetical protein